MGGIIKSVSNQKQSEQYSKKQLDEINEFVKSFKLAQHQKSSSKKEELLLYKYDNDKREILEQGKIFKNIGQMIIKKNKGGLTGTCSLIQFELPQHILQEVDRQEYNETQKFFFLLTCAHNVDDSTYVDQELIGKRDLAWKTLVIFGKQQDKDFNKEPLAKKELSLIIYINPSNIFVHSKYNGNQASGYDIALIGLEKHDYKNIESYIQINQKSVQQNGQQSAFKENNLFQLFYNQNLNKKKKYRLGVCGYPGDPPEYRIQGYPQVQMFEEITDIDRIEFMKDGKVVLYDFIQTTEGQSGSPIIFCEDGVQQIIGVHTGFECGKNLGTLIESLSYQSLKKQFCLLDKQELKKFDLLMIKQVKIQDEYMQEKSGNQLETKKSISLLSPIEPKQIENSSPFNNQHNEILEDLNKIFKQYELDPSEENFQLALQAAISLKYSGKENFDQWYESIHHNSKIGKNFKDKFNFFQAREESGILVQMLQQIKEKFPDPKKMFTQEDFNRLNSRLDINKQFQMFKETQANPEKFVQNIFTQLLYLVKLKLNISKLAALLKRLKLPVEVSSRFLLNLVIQNSDIGLRTRILHNQSEFFSLPLIMNYQTTFQSEKYILHYVPEVVFSMLEGMGIFNFAAGKRCIHPTGKSMLINDLLFPSQEFQHEAFEQQDKNLFSSGQVDVFFEKSFDVKRNFVMIDGQGLLKLEAIQSSLILTNIAMIHFHHKDLQEKKIVEDLKSKIQLIRQSETQNIKITIILIIRDSSDTKILKTIDDQQKFSNVYPLLSSIEDEIDQAIQLSNMSTMQKMERLEELKPMLQMFYTTIEFYNSNSQKSKFKFTKKNFSEKFMMQDQSQKSNAKLIQDIIYKSFYFSEKVKKFQQNIFAQNALPVLDIKNMIRQKIIQLRNTIQNDNLMQEQIEAELEKQLEDLKQKLRSTKPSEIMYMFKSLVEDPNSSIIFLDIDKYLKKLSFENTEEPKQKKLKLIYEYEQESLKNKNKSKEEVEQRNLKLQNQLDKLDDEIQQKSISLEYFWRCLVYFLERDSEFKEWNQGSSKYKIIDCIENKIKNGDRFELIDGENLEFKALLIKEIVKVSKNDKVIVVCIIGPHSSGKSTLLNFAFGTQFFTSTERCTKGIYFTLQKLSDDIKNDSGVKWLIILDTEGLQSPGKIDDEYERKIVLFAMLSSDVLIINNKGEINSNMINTLKMCYVTYDDIHQFGNKPEIIYTFNQHTFKDKEHLKAQVESLKQGVISAKANESKTIQKTAEDLLGYNDEKLNIFGYAYKKEIIQEDLEKGIKQEIFFKNNFAQYEVEAAHILEIILRLVNDKNKTFKDIQLWLTSSKQNWDLTDRCISNIIQFKNLEELSNDRKVKEFFNSQWNRYLLEQDDEENDQMKCEQQSLILINIFKKFGEQQLQLELEKFFLENSKQKDADLQKYVLNAYEKWKRDLNEYGININTEKRNKRDINSRNNFLKKKYNDMLIDKVNQQKQLIIHQGSIQSAQTIHKKSDKKS